MLSWRLGLMRNRENYLQRNIELKYCLLTPSPSPCWGTPRYCQPWRLVCWQNAWKLLFLFSLLLTGQTLPGDWGEKIYLRIFQILFLMTVSPWAIFTLCIFTTNWGVRCEVVLLCIDYVFSVYLYSDSHIYLHWDTQWYTLHTLPSQISHYLSSQQSSCRTQARTGQNITDIWLI